MSDRELLELAAKAAGYEPAVVTDDGCVLLRGIQVKWAPLQNDGDALRLAVALKFDIYNYPRDSEPYVSVHDEDNRNGGSSEDYGSDALKATRRAIVCCAAELGRGMP